MEEGNFAATLMVNHTLIYREPLFSENSRDQLYPRLPPSNWLEVQSFPDLKTVGPKLKRTNSVKILSRVMRWSRNAADYRVLMSRLV